MKILENSHHFIYIFFKYLLMLMGLSKILIYHMKIYKIYRFRLQNFQTKNNNLCFYHHYQL